MKADSTSDSAVTRSSERPRLALGWLLVGLGVGGWLLIGAVWLLITVVFNHW